MKRIALIILTTVSIGLLLVSCDNKNNPEEKPEENEPGVAEIDRTLLYGEWDIVKAKYAQDATMTEWDQKETTFIFKENGLYKGEGYYGDVEGIYTIKGNVITVLINSVAYAEYKVLAQTEEVLTLCASFTTTPTKIWMECTKPEYLEEPPIDKIDTETFFRTESDVQLLVSKLYESTTSFYNAQYQVEWAIHYKEREKLLPSSPEIKKLMSAGYVAIREANTIIKALKGIDDTKINYNKNQYLTHARVLRDFVYYNMNHLWGGVPLVTEDMTVEETMQIARSEESTLYDFLLSDLLNLEGFPQTPWMPNNYSVNERTINMLLTECYLAKADYSNAQKYAELAVTGNSGDIYILYYANPLDPNSTLGNIIYSSQKANLFLLESKRQLDNLVNAWDESYAWYYGYWAAMKRLGVAKEKAECEDYQLLLPIPANEILNNPNMVQNPGY